MYPGSPRRPGLDVDFSGGTTVVLGANGLGKTTLITLLFRLCVGPYEITNLHTGELGERKLETTRLAAAQRRLFANRVNDGAQEALATLALTVGTTRLVTTRALDNLSLVTLIRNDEELEASDTEFQQEIVKAAGLTRYADWVLLMRFVTFYFEDRRALVWDASAQRQVLRMLFLPRDVSEEWAEMQADVNRRDSNMRNLRASLTMASREVVRNEAAIEERPKLRKDLEALKREQERDETLLDQVSDQLVTLEAQQEAARYNALQAEQARDAAYRDLERLQLLAIGSRFPDRDATARYLLSKLFSDGRCLTCEQEAPAAVTSLERRVEDDKCVVCGSDLLHRATNGRSLSSRRIMRAQAQLHDAEVREAVTREQREQSERAFAAARTEVHRLRREVANRADQLDAVLSKLPPEESTLHEARRELNAIRARVDEMKLELERAQDEYTVFIGKMSRRIARRKTAVQDVFTEFAEGFLLEQCRLIYRPHKAQLGQSGRYIEYPAFDLDMSGATFASPVRREGPEQVSESQREFIDLAFRMTLMSVAGAGGVGSLIIDAPESSLDAVFVGRAAEVLSRFLKRAKDNRLVVTSNLVEGNLIPALLKKSGITSSRDSRVVDLLALAAPTAATEQLNDQYKKVRRDVFAKARA